MFLKRINGDEVDRLIEYGIHVFVFISLPLSYDSLTKVSDVQCCSSISTGIG